jgi:hypothetical protein
MAGFKTFLETLGADAKKVFSWVGTPKGEATITAVEGAGEAVVDAVDPALAAINPLITNWTQEIFKAEALATAAGAQTGTGTQKAADVAESITPQVVAFAQQYGLNAPTAADINTINTALVTVLNTLTVAVTPAAPAAQ